MFFRPILKQASAVLLSLLTSFEPASADRLLSEKEILARCYAQLTGRRLPVSDSLWSRLTKQSAQSVCADLLNQVNFAPNGTLSASADPLHRRILKQFHDFHRSWFSKQWIMDSTLPDVNYGTVDVYDPAAPSYYLTRALFLPNSHYAQVLRGYETLAAVRDSGKIRFGLSPTGGIPRLTRAFSIGDISPDQSEIPGSFDRHEITVQNPQDGSVFSIPGALVPVGELIGVVPAARGTYPFLWVNPLTPAAAANPPGLVVPQGIDAHYGGGALGTISFLLMNLGHGADYAADGAAKLPRRAVEAAMHSFLCRKGPSLRATDVGSYLAGEIAAVPFRKTTACLRCHATLDQAALTLRHVRQASTGNYGPAKIVRYTSTISSYGSLSTASPEWPSVPTPNFALTAPVGRLYFRSINGSLVNVPVGNLDGLGHALSATEDFYACAASRYFKYFTGIEVNLFDPQDPDNIPLVSSLNDSDRDLRAFVLALGKELQTTGHLKTLVQHILTSPYYKRAGFGR